MQASLQQQGLQALLWVGHVYGRPLSFVYNYQSAACTVHASSRLCDDSLTSLGAMKIVM